DHDQLFTAARAMATRMAANSPLAVQGAKQILNGGVGRPIRESLREIALWNSAFLASHDLQEAIMAFAEKRTPTFTGK
ncbi:MAG: enoyl-CoA hydratase-related protein, partial [Polyangiales bacterium]